MAAPIKCISVRRQNWQNGAKYDNVPKCNLELVWWKSAVVAVTSFSLHILLFLILPTKFLSTSSAWHRMPYGPQSYTRRRGGILTSKISAPVTSQLIQRLGEREVCFRNVQTYPTMPPFCYGTVYIYIYIYASSVAKPGTFSSTAERFLRGTYAARRK